MILWSSTTDDWATPPEIFAALDDEFGFRMDVATSTNTKVPDNWCGPDHIHPARRNGLRYHWKTGPVWCNPPYGRGIGKWLAKADHTSAAIGITIVCLVPARTDTAWFHDHCIHHEVRFIHGRLKFNGHTKDAPFPSMVVVMR